MGKESLADIIRKQREARGFSQRELARLAQCDSGEISRLEGGQRLKPRIETLWRIAPHLGLDPMDLVRIARDLPVDPEAAKKADGVIELRRINRDKQKEELANVGKVFGEHVRILRAEERLERDELAKQIGISYAVTTRCELGKLPELRVIYRIAERFGVSIDWLFGRTAVRTLATDETSAAQQYVIFTSDMELPEGADFESLRRFLTEMSSLAKRTNARDREVILNISREMATKK